LGYAVAFSPDGGYLAVPGRQGKAKHTVNVWNLEAGNGLPPTKSSLEGHGDVVRGIAFSPDGTHLASAAEASAGPEDGNVRVWAFKEGREVLRLKDAHLSGAYAVAYSPDGKLLASCGKDAKVMLWNMANGREVRVFAGHVGEVYGVAYSHDGKLLASAGQDKTIRLWDAASGRALRVLHGHTEPALCVAFSPDDQRLATGDAGVTMKVWDTTNGREVSARLTITSVSRVLPSARTDTPSPRPVPSPTRKCPTSCEGGVR